jgi:TRAP-type transport system small permease protein
MLEKIKKVMGRIRGVILAVCGLSIAVMTIYGFIDVWARFLLNHPLYGTYEISEILLVVVVFLSVSACEAEGRHMRVDLIFPYISQTLHGVVDIIAYVCGIVTCGLLIFYIFPRALYSWQIGEHSEGIIPFPIYPSKIVIVVGLALLVIELLLRITDTLKDFKADRKPPKVIGPDISHASDQI